MEASFLIVVLSTLTYDIKGGGGKIYPLEKLKATCQPNDYVVISVGGNDFREQLLNPLGLLTIIPKVQARYMQIVDEVQKLKLKPILMFQYRPDAVDERPYYIYSIFGAVGVFFAAVHVLSLGIIGAAGLAWIRQKIKGVTGIAVMAIGAVVLALSRRVVPLQFTKDVIFNRQRPGMTLIGYLMEKFYRPILERSNAKGIPVIDLCNRFHPLNTNLYIASIEPSSQGGALIAHFIHCEVQKYQILLNRINPASWRVQYPRVLKESPARWALRRP